MNYVAPGWLPGGNLQTIWAAVAARRPGCERLAWERERWDTPDGDFVDVDWLRTEADASRSAGPPQARLAPSGGSAVREATSVGAARSSPLLVLFHGLEGSSRSHYAQAFAAHALEHGWRFAIPHFRGCGGELNRGPRAYHSGDHEEIDWILRRMKAQHGGPVMAAGVSLGGNALMRWAGEAGDGARDVVCAVAAVSSPLDLAAGGHAIGRGFNRLIYTRMFLASMKPKALAKLEQHPGLFDGERVRNARDLYAFDDAFTAPLHGFDGVEDYWARASAKPHLHAIRVPALLVNARNDPFVPAESLPTTADVSPLVTLWQPETGGHVGFPAGRFPAHVRAMPDAVSDWLAAQCTAMDSRHG